MTSLWPVCAVSVRWVTLFPLGSLVLLLCADVIAIVGHWTSTRVLNFLAGILSVIGGMIHNARTLKYTGCAKK